MAETIGFLGPGLMGRGIVKNLLAKGHKVMVLAHREGLKLDELVGAGAAVTKSLTEVGERNGVVMLCVPSSIEVEAAILGKPGLFHSMREGSTVIDLSTSLPASTRMLAERLAERKIAFLDAPMTGTPVHANAGELNLMIGGEKAVYEREYNQPLPMVNALLGVLDIAKASGLGDENSSALVKLWERVAQVEVRGEGVGL